MNLSLGIWILLGIEAACIATIRWLVRRRGELVRRYLARIADGGYA